MNVIPLYDRLIVQRLEKSAPEAGAILVPDSGREKPQRGTVVAAGLGTFNQRGQLVPLDVKAGDTIVFDQSCGQEIKVDGVEYLIMKEEDVLAIEIPGLATTTGQEDSGAAKKRS